jgi:hypothetical protein
MVIYNCKEVKDMNITELMIKQKGKWIFTLEDNSKWVLDFSTMTFDSYEWYKKVGTLESEITNINEFIQKSKNVKRIY